MDASTLRLYRSDWSYLITYVSCTDKKCDYAVQDNAYCWIVTRNNLFTFNGTTIYNLSNLGITGDAICYWKGRIFIARDRTLMFSVPNPNPTGSPNPFDVGQGAGAIQLGISQFSQILALVPKEDAIYLFTDRSIISLVGTTISNDPTSWYMTEVVRELGIVDKRRYVVDGKTVYFQTPLGIYSIIATSPEKIDDAITDLTDRAVAISKLSYKQVPYIAVIAPSAVDQGQNAVYCYNLLTKRWYALDISGGMLVNDVADTFVVSDRYIYKLFDATSYMPLVVRSKVYFSVDNVYFNLKNVVLYGRGSYQYAQDFISLVFGAQQDKILFRTDQGSLTIISSQGDFWYAVLKPAIVLPYNPQPTTQYQMRVKQFQIEIRQTDSAYSELINIAINGTIGARYV